MMTIHKNTPVDEILANGEKNPEGGRGCHLGGGFVKKDEVGKIARHLGMNEANVQQAYLDTADVFHTKTFKTKTKRAAGKPYGPCIFLDEKKGSCTIKDAKPLYCKVTNNDSAEQTAQWYYVNFCVNADDPSSIREWKAYADTAKIIPGGRPEELVGNERLFQIMSYHDISLQPPTPMKRPSKG